MHTLNELLAHSRRMLTGQVQPVEDRMRFTMLDPADGPQTVALDQHRYGI
jgi:hypothetical protein